MCFPFKREIWRMCFENSPRSGFVKILLVIVSSVLLDTIKCEKHKWQAIGQTRVVETKQGALQGQVTASRTNANLRNVEVFLGIPYAAPPVGSQRFMPPGSPPRWRKIRQANHLGYVCPQKLPTLGKRPQDMSPDRDRLLKKLLPYLQNQNEDCLYLNIYAPARDNPNVTKIYPVIVFIHGESFEWNSGNPYDGSILASYGEVIVVTLNFRLGILGFLRPGVGDHTLSNFGLLDQLAALQWIKDNIEAFGGDENSVTLMGYDTGAACVNYLMVSPVSQGGKTGLFHRAILMSGTALADWAFTVNPIHYTVQVAHALNCPETSDGMPPCLRRKRLQDIMAVNVAAPPFRTAFGPVIDGTVVPNEPAELMTTYKHLFSRYELMYGLTEVESYHLLDGVSLAQGMLEEDKSKLLKDYIRAKYQALPNVALGKTIGQYTNMKLVGPYSAAEENRNIILSILSDARVAAPLVQTANFHSQANPKSYFYVFRHRSKFGEYRSIEKSVHGEELQYIFGIPTDTSNSPSSNPYYNTPEKALSEYVMTLWSNFAKTGNPNAPRKHPFVDQRQREWRHFDIEWPEYNIYNQSYLSIGIPPKINHHYRHEMMKYWNELLPEYLKNPSLANNYHPVRYNEEDQWVIDPRPIAPFPAPPPPPISRYEPPKAPYKTQNEFENWNPYYNFNHTIETDHSDNLPSGQMDVPDYKVVDKNLDKNKNSDDEIHSAASSLTLTIVIFIGICFLFINLCIFIGLYYQKDKLKVQERIFNSQYRCGAGSLSIEDNDDRYMKASDNNAGTEMPTRDKTGKRKTAGVKSILKSSEGIYEPVKVESLKTCSEIGDSHRWHGETGGVTRQTSSSTVTMDPHTKVREWIAHEIKHRCSPKFLRKGKMLRKVGGNSTDTYTEPLSIQTNDKDDSIISKLEGSTTTLQRSKATKVSVAIDATPATRSPSVLQQIPIELTKSLDNVKDSLGMRENVKNLKTSMSLGTLSKRPSLQRSDALTTNADGSEISCQESCVPASESTSYNYPETAIVHSHSISDPSPISDEDSKSSISRLDGIRLVPKKSKSNNDVLYTQIAKEKTKKRLMGSFSINPNDIDINVTSRDDMTNEKGFSSHEDALDNIKRRNFPKVLPDFPENIDDNNQKGSKRRSLPPTSHLLQPPLEFSGISSGGISPDGSLKDFKNRIPPPPPPRVSTLGRRPVNTSPVSPLSSSHIKVHLGNKSSSDDLTNSLINTIIPETSTQMSTLSRIQAPIPVKTPQVPNSPTNKTAIKESKSEQTKPQNLQKDMPSTEKIKRIEPKIIIKPVMTNPITSSTKKDFNTSTRLFGSSQNIPRVTQMPTVHTVDIGIPVGKPEEKRPNQKATTKTPLSQPDPNMGIGKKIKINPVKKSGVSVSTETAVDSVDGSSESNTGTIKRVKK